jgi:hypothetical protein
MAYDPVAKKVIRWAGHNQGGGGEQNAETWTFDPRTGSWELMRTNRRPPGACCNQQNVFDTSVGRFIRFPAFSGSHGWQWFREVYLNNTSVWTYDLAENRWREMCPLPEPRVRPLRCASWDSDLGVVVLFGGEGGNDGTLIYDPYTNTWTDMNPPVEPAPRSGGNMVYDSKNKLHILFGSQFSDDPHTWAYDASKNEWRDLKPAATAPTNRNDPAMCYDAASAKVIAVLRAVTKQADNGEPTEGRFETWAYDAAANTWEKIADGPEGWGSRNRVLTYLPDLNLCLLELSHHGDRERGVEREQQVWTLRLAQTPAIAGSGADGRPAPPRDVTMTPFGDGVKLNWTAQRRGEGAPGGPGGRLTY